MSGSGSSNSASARKMMPPRPSQPIPIRGNASGSNTPASGAGGEVGAGGSRVDLMSKSCPPRTPNFGSLPAPIRQVPGLTLPPVPETEFSISFIGSMHSAPAGPMYRPPVESTSMEREEENPTVLSFMSDRLSLEEAVGAPGPSGKQVLPDMDFEAGDEPDLLSPAMGDMFELSESDHGQFRKSHAISMGSADSDAYPDAQLPFGSSHDFAN